MAKQPDKSGNNNESLMKFMTQVEGVANQLAKDIQETLSASDQKLIKAVMTGMLEIKEKYGTDIAKAVKRFNQLYKELETLRKEAMTKAQEQAKETAQKTAEWAGYKMAKELAESAKAKKKNVKPLTAKQLKTILDYQPFAGQSISQWFDQYKFNDIRRITNAITQAYSEKLTVADIIKRIRGTKANNYTDGILQTSRTSATMLARTMINGVANEARLETMMANSDVIDGLQFLATLDGRTSFVCASLDGKIWKGEEMKNAKRPPLHPNCRSTLIPYIEIRDENGKLLEEQATRPAAARDFEEDAKKAYNQAAREKGQSKRWEDLSAATRKRYYYQAIKDYESETGKPAYTQAKGSTTFKDYFEKQPEAFKRSWLGPKRYEFYKADKLPFESLVKSDTGYTVPVNELSKESLQPITTQRDINDRKTATKIDIPIDKTPKSDIIYNIGKDKKKRSSGPASGNDMRFENSVRYEAEQSRLVFKSMTEKDKARTKADDLKNATPVVNSETFNQMYNPIAQLLEEPQKEAFKKYYARLKEIDGWDEKESEKARSRKIALSILLQTPGVEEIEYKKRVAALNILFPSNNPESDNRKHLRELPITYGDKKDHTKEDQAVRAGLDFFGRVMDNAGIDITHNTVQLEGYSGNSAEYSPMHKRIHFRNGSFSQLVQDAIHEAAHHWEESLSVNTERRNGLVNAVEEYYKQITTNSAGEQYPAKPSKQFSGKFRKANIKLPPDDYITCETGRPTKEILQEFMRSLYKSPVEIATEYPEWFNGMMRFLR
ncbi:MAG: minor capsid protein [Planctomycetia bacterium]|nr:minor capsid protein [Planctomycetia bacterium]